MPFRPELVYDGSRGAILLAAGSEQIEIYTDATRREFELVQAAHTVHTELSVLFAEMLDLMEEQGGLRAQSDYFSRVNSIAQEAARLYEECIELQTVIEGFESEIVSEQLKILYKTEKNIKHFLRCHSVAQRLGYSQRLLQNFLGSGDYVFLYGFIRSTCSTFEHLGMLVENRLGAGDLDISSKGLTFVQVHEALHNQDLGEPFNENRSVCIHPHGESIRFGDIPLEPDLAEYLWDKRNGIAHRSPLVVNDATADRLPEDIMSSMVLTDSEMERLLYLSHRLHLHSIGMFHRLCYHYETNPVEAYVDAIHPDG